MKFVNVNDKYPSYVTSIKKENIKAKSIDEIINHLKEKIEENKARFIGDFDHYSHTKSLEDGEVAKEIKNCKMVIFCFGKNLNDSQTTAARPRSIGVTEFEDRFEFAFLEAPSSSANEKMASWIKELIV